jgi:glutathione S-transferase
MRFSPAGKWPSLHDGEIVVWDSLAIIEYVAARMPIWPRPRAARAQARSLAAKMHSGFMGIRGLLPMNMRRKVKQRELTPGGTQGVRSSWRFSLRRFFGGRRDVRAGGHRLHVYKVAVTPGTRAYMDDGVACLAKLERASPSRNLDHRQK